MPLRAQKKTLSAFRVHSFSPQREVCVCSRAAFIPDSTNLGSTRVLWHLDDPREVFPTSVFPKCISEKPGPGLPLAAIFCPIALIPPSFSSLNWEPACCSYHRPPAHQQKLRTGTSSGLETARGIPPVSAQHSPRNLRKASTSPGTLHTVLISMGTTSGGCSFTSWTLEGQWRCHPCSGPTLNPAHLPWGESEAPTCAGCP